MQATIDINVKVINTSFLKNNARYLFVYGNRGGGKTTTAVDKIIVDALLYPGSISLILRKTHNSLYRTIGKVFTDRLQHIWKVPHKYKVGEASFPNGSIVYLDSYYLPNSNKTNERLKSMTVDKILIEEATEFSLEDLKELNWIVRGQKAPLQMILLFNPPRSSNHPIYQFYDLHKDKAERVFFDNRLNPYLPDEYLEELENLKHYDIGQYKRYALGQWRVNVSSDSLIYPDWEEVNIDFQKEMDKYVIGGGIDFGYVKDHPFVFVLAGLREDGRYRELVVFKELYIRYKTTSEAGEEVKKILEEYGIPSLKIYCDSARPDAIQELADIGLNVFPSVKGKNSVVEGIDLIKNYKIKINSGCEEMKSEIQDYSWKKDREGRIIYEPVKFHDDGMDALRYFVYSHIKERNKISRAGGVK